MYRICGCSIFRFPPPHIPQSHAFIEALRQELAAVAEHEALAGEQPAHGPVPGSRPRRLRRDARSEDHRRAEEVAVFFDRLAGVEADADVQRLRHRLGVRGERALESDGALHG